MDYNSVNSNERKIDKQNCKLWYKNHVPIWARSVTISERTGIKSSR